MTDSDTGDLQAEYPSLQVPAIFTDGVLNLANSKHVVKFYLARSDPSTTSPSDALTRPHAQVIMPITSFVRTVDVFQQCLENMIKNGDIDEASVSALRLEGREESE